MPSRCLCVNIEGIGTGNFYPSYYQFVNAAKVRNKLRGKKARAKILANEVLDCIGKLYHIEKKLRSMS
jgi:hypothetical protein